METSTVELFAQINERADKAIRRAKGGIRRGQALYNALCHVRPDITDSILAKECDPFYDDKKIPAFWVAVQKAAEEG